MAAYNDPYDSVQKDINMHPNRVPGPIERAGIAAKEKAIAEQIGRAVPRYNGDAHIGIPDSSNLNKYEAPCAGLTAAQMPDPVNSPSHYTDGGIETIDFIEAKKLNYNLGNVVKYITRAGKKSRLDLVIQTPYQIDCSKLEDLEKAAWYLAREIKTLKGK